MCRSKKEEISGKSELTALVLCGYAAVMIEKNHAAYNIAVTILYVIGILTTYIVHRVIVKLTQISCSFSGKCFHNAVIQKLSSNLVVCFDVYVLTIHIKLHNTTHILLFVCQQI